MCHDGIPPVDHTGIIPAFIEHTHIHTKIVSHVDSAGCGALIRADDHQVVCVNLQIWHMGQKSLDKLVRRLYCLKTAHGNGILHPRIMGIKGNDVFHTHTV